jgi:hypothetical protein
MIQNDAIVSVMRSLWFRYVEVWRASGMSLRRSAIEPLELARQKAQAMSGDHDGGAAYDVEIGGGEASGVARSSRRKKKAKAPSLKGPRNLEKQEAESELKSADEIFSPPSKPLILGFVNLACRILRTWVIPGDIVRWCQNGALPILNLWASPFLTDSDRAKLTEAGKAWRRVFTKQYFTSHLLPTVSNISFHTHMLANMLKVPVPPLNAPLIARRMINAMGLPEDVWLLYNRITRMHRMLEAPPQYLRSYKQHHAENIIVALLVASKLTPGWTYWIVERDLGIKSVSSGVAAPTRAGLIASSEYVRGYVDQPLSIKHTDMLLRRDLDRYVAQVEREALLSSKAVQLATGGSWAYNSEINAVFAKKTDSEQMYGSQSSNLERDESQLGVAPLPKGYSKHYLTAPVSSGVGAASESHVGSGQKMSESSFGFLNPSVSPTSRVQVPAVDETDVKSGRRRSDNDSEGPRRKYSRRSLEVSGLDDPSAVFVGTAPHLSSVFYTPSLAASVLPLAEQGGSVDDTANIVCSYLVDRGEPASTALHLPPHPEYTLLLERFAKYACIAPGHLHLLLTELESKMFKIPGVLRSKEGLSSLNPPSEALLPQGVDHRDVLSPGSAVAFQGSDSVPHSTSISRAHDACDSPVDAYIRLGEANTAILRDRRGGSEQSSEGTLSQRPFTQDSASRMDQYMYMSPKDSAGDSTGSDTDSMHASVSSSEEDVGYLSSSSGEVT